MRFCAYCGKELPERAEICLNCGCRSRVINTTSFSNRCCKQEIYEGKHEPTLAKCSKIIGIISFFIGWFVLGIAAVILAQISKKETNGKLCQSAKVGFVCGIVSTVLSLLIIFSVIGFLIDLFMFLEPLMDFFEVASEFLTIIEGYI